MVDTPVSESGPILTQKPIENVTVFASLLFTCVRCVCVCVCVCVSVKIWPQTSGKGEDNLLAG